MSKPPVSPAHPMAPPLIRTGRRDKVERFQAVDKMARSRYAALLGFEFAVQAPGVAAEQARVGLLSLSKPLSGLPCWAPSR
jgi:hypothetical protein